MRFFFTRITALTLAPVLGISYYYRPVGDNDEIDKKSGPKRNGLLTSEQSLCDRANVPPPLLYRMASAMIILATTSVTRVFIYCGGKFHVKDDKNYTNFINRVQRREHGVPLLTVRGHSEMKVLQAQSFTGDYFLQKKNVSNHRSMLDDPAMMSSILPLWMSVQPKYIRWSVCAQDFCFNPAYSSIISTLSGLGKVMPIKRGAGINQKLLLDFARRLAAGDWCHVFPEGGIWQRPVLGGRENGKEGEIGHLKWGVGKLIAHSPKKAIVIPFTHMGMETVMPQHPVTKVLATTIPQPGHDVSVRFGEELDFDDLIKEHEALYGILWKYTASVDDDKEGDFHEHWDSKPEELVLYHKITLRIEKSLAALLKQ